MLVVVTIGLDQEPIIVDEGDGTAEICANVIEGDLQREVVVTVTIEDGEASGEWSTHCKYSRCNNVLIFI